MLIAIGTAEVFWPAWRIDVLIGYVTLLCEGIIRGPYSGDFRSPPQYANYMKINIMIGVKKCIRLLKRPVIFNREKPCRIHQVRDV
jgi:hypothetical protein